MNANSARRVPEAGVEQREHVRSALGLPAIVSVEDQDYSARIVNIAPGGAMIETPALLRTGMSVLLRCGSIFAQAVVVWSSGCQTGVNFVVPLNDRELAEQLARTAAMSSRRLLRHASGDGVPSPTA